MICLFLLPIYIDIRSQTEQVEVNQRAEQLMFEELQAQFMNTPTYSNYSVYDSGIEYKVFWRDSVLNGKEVCVKVEHSSFNFQTEICSVQE